MTLPQCRLPHFCLALWQDLHSCYERVMLCAIQAGCLLSRLPGVLVPLEFDLKVKSGNHQLMVSV